MPSFVHVMSWATQDRHAAVTSAGSHGVVTPYRRGVKHEDVSGADANIYLYLWLTPPTNIYFNWGAILSLRPFEVEALVKKDVFLAASLYTEAGVTRFFGK